MCFVYDGWNEFSRTEFPKARKEHRCDECFEPIVKGEKHMYYVAKFDGDFSSTRTCRRCEYLRDEISKKEIASGCGYSESWCPIGELKESLKEYGLALIPKDQVPADFKMS